MSDKLNVLQKKKVIASEILRPTLRKYDANCVNVYAF